VRVAAALVVLGALLPSAARAHGDGGATLYATSCASCHGARGEGSKLAPPLLGRSAADVHFMLDTGRMPAAAPGVNEIARPPLFSERQIGEIVTFVVRLTPGTRSSELPRVAPGDARRGRALFAANCAQCHGAAGDGASVGSDDVAPSLGSATPLQIAEAIRIGPGVMPRFGRDVLDDRDVDDLAAYITYLRSRAAASNGVNAGGFSLAHLGPVAEGFIGWLFGLGALVLFVRAVGSAGKDA
jgi:ubiquinol-cytochrome c reductase cytochrome c subunit